MNKVNERFKKIIYWEYFPFLIFACSMGILHIFMNPFRDDLVYSGILSKEPLFLLMMNEYFRWSSRVIILPVATYFAAQNFMLFSIIDSLIYFLLPYMISKIFMQINKYEKNWIIVFLLACVPFITMMSTAGWVITSTYYLWPLTFGLIALYPLKKVSFHESIKWYEIIFYVIVTIFAANMEIMAAIIMTFYIIFAVYFFCKKKNHWFIIFQTIILIGNMIYILTCPGNMARDLVESTSRFPEYVNLNVIEKLALSATSSLVCIDLNFVILVVLGMVCVYSWNKFKTIIQRIICAIPFIFCLVINFIRIILFGQKFTRVFSESTGITLIYPINYWDLVNVVPGVYQYVILLFMSIFAFSLILMTFVLFENTNLKWLAFLVMSAGIMSRVVMGFSATVYASGARTFLFSYIAFTIYGFLLFQTFDTELSEKKQKMLVRCLCILAIMGCLQSCLYLFYINICLK